MFITCYDTYRLSRNIRIRIYTFIELNPHLCRSNPFSSPQLLQKLIEYNPWRFHKCIRNMAVHLNNCLIYQPITHLTTMMENCEYEKVRTIFKYL